MRFSVLLIEILCSCPSPRGRDAHRWTVSAALPGTAKELNFMSSLMYVILK